MAQTAATSLSFMRFDCNDYSVPTTYAHHDVTALGGIQEVRPVVGTETVAPTHAVGARSRSPSTSATTLPSWNGNPVPWTTPGHWRGEPP